MGDAAIRIEGVGVDYPVRAGILRPPRLLRALRGVDLEVGRGEVVGLVGESGCGKSTLSRVLLGIERPSRGTVAIDGRPVGSYGRRERARLMQPVFQDPYSSLNPRLTVGSIVSAPLAVRGEGTVRARADRTREMLDRVGLPPHLRDATPGQLSGGQRQRVAIARALIGEPQLLICDEPTSALDVSVQAQILNLLLRLRREMGLTMLLISHNLAVVNHVADRIAVMYLGRIVEVGPAAEVFDAPRHPYTSLLIGSILSPVPGAAPRPARAVADLPSPLDVPAGCAFHGRCARALEPCPTVPPAIRGATPAHAAACHNPLPQAGRAPPGTAGLALA